MRNRLFESIKIRPPRKNVFDLSHEKRLTCNFADLVPIYLQEVLPSDSFRVSTESLIRLFPMISPVMHRVNVYIHYFFVPNRLVWDNWKDFITGGVDGKSAPAFPKLSFDNTNKLETQVGSLADYLGVPDISPNSVTYGMNVNALPFKAYQLIYNEYYRDQTLTPAIDLRTDENGVTTNTVDFTKIRKRSWEKDYFTSAMPFTQRGDDVLLPNTLKYRSIAQVLNNDGTPNATSGPLTATNADLTLNSGPGKGIDNVESLEVTINDLRTSARLQEYLEKMARAGSRYVEQILALWGVISDDLQQSRPLYLGGNSQPITISEVLAHFGSAEIPQGNMAGHGLSVGAGQGFKHYFKEHGYILGIMSTIPRSSYCQGLDRTLIKDSKFDFFTPDFAHLGEQPVYSGELYHDGQSNTLMETFGYQSRYAEYKFQKSSIHGNFKTDLDYWTMARIFDSKPNLNAEFVECDPTTRIFATTDQSHKLMVQLYNHVKAIRPIPVYGTPKL